MNVDISGCLYLLRDMRAYNFGRVHAYFSIQFHFAHNHNFDLIRYNIAPGIAKHFSIVLIPSAVKT